jgi:hypothetical protein
LPHKKIRLLESFLNETLLRAQQKKPIILSHRGIRRCYTKGMKSIYMNMPVPLAIVGGEAFGNFAIVSVENAVNHLLGQADRAYGTEISPRLFVMSFVILLYAILYNICI